MKNETQQASTPSAPALFPPGPWKAHGCTVYEADKWKDGNNEGGRFVACTVDPEFLEMPTDEMHARAVALAALPELLEALTRFVERSERMGMMEGSCRIARAAIAKAEGVI